jgi:hypothetical protein
VSKLLAGVNLPVIRASEMDINDFQEAALGPEMGRMCVRKFYFHAHYTDVAPVALVARRVI